MELCQKKHYIVRAVKIQVLYSMDMKDSSIGIMQKHENPCILQDESS